MFGIAGVDFRFQQIVNRNHPHLIEIAGHFRVALQSFRRLFSSLYRHIRRQDIEIGRLGLQGQIQLLGLDLQLRLINTQF